MCVGMFVLCLFDLLVSSVVSVVMVGCFMKCVSVVLLFSLCFIVSISCDISNEWLFSLKNDVLWLILFGVSLSNVVYILVRCIFSVLCGVLWVLFFVCDIGRCVSVVWLILLFGVVGNMLSVVMLYGIMQLGSVVVSMVCSVLGVVVVLIGFVVNRWMCLCLLGIIVYWWYNFVVSVVVLILFGLM